MGKKSIITTISSEEFAKIVSQSTSVCEILRHFGFSKASGSMSKVVKDRIMRENIDISHFKNGNKKGGKPVYTLDEILIKDSTYTNIAQLKKRLIRENLLPYECESCGNKGEWNSKPLVLQLEHKNGDHSDHRLSNLCFLCPNCHSQTKTFAGRNAAKSTKWKDYRKSK